MTNRKITPVILSGGSGTRLWPVSRSLYPKQLLPLVSEQTMIQETVLRVKNPDHFNQPLFIANEEHRFIIAEQLRKIGFEDAKIILEPEGRNTAPAAALAALYIQMSDPAGLMLIMPSDHVIAHEEAFQIALNIAKQAAEEEKMLTAFGIVPDKPETGYGYIKCGDNLESVYGCNMVDKFVEKPDLKTANEYLNAGGYYWNSGIFLFPVAQYLDILAANEPEMLIACKKAIDGAKNDMTFIRPDKESFLKCPSNSIDYAVMEKTDRAAVVPVDMGWNDVGSWNALWDISEKDKDGNVVSGDVISHESKNCLLKTDGPALASVGLENLIVVATKDAVLVCDKHKTQDVKAIVDRLKASGRAEHISHTVVYRPWGSYQTSDADERFQVKRLVVNPGQILSLQMHHHRAEHWVVVKGTAEVTINDKVSTLSENESCYIPIGATHRLKNPGKIPLFIVEVQSGSYLGEDDIVRFEDTYGRS
ncbi:MAG: mannose-1-phosphate guanylyltransferase/mannose-6-phosphate isomerase [Alphaproteobacteria bacterium]|nr:mannose-1-phosphate guanylyltransferase/mannose-6-phosphate isomerase [Alphaproteobacteria bacterium]HPF45546.1 mannose-1-phosphate guanylyltransferase/mannose-6-phosphate isomerase [Emcibacteraceae bacterium]HRW30137.1 mannose-1-phosphate guanylyltransferase/mannose-6-phosphate isomerase [Emcibacteraceae bacterium]